MRLPKYGYANDSHQPPASPPRKLGKLKSLPEANQVRSIFDDIDAINDAPEN